MKASLFPCFCIAAMLVLFVSGCDPARRINMYNDTNADVEIEFKMKEDSMLHSPFYLSSSKSLNLVLNPTPAGRKIKMSAGVGTWTPKYLRSVVDDLDSLTIRWNQKTIRLGTQDDIYKFLLSRRKGLGKDKIVLRFNANKNNPDGL